MKRVFYFLILFVFIFSYLVFSESFRKREISKTSDKDNLALNSEAKGYPSVLGSDKGWGGGSFVWEIVDGLRTYDEWQHGIAFCGGKKGWCGEQCGWREILIDFGRPVRFNRVVVWHHGFEHVPNVYKIQYLDMETGDYKTVFSTNNGKNFLKFQIVKNPTDWWESFSTPTENIFSPVVSTRLRYVINNCDIEHGWIYEIEVY